jgi:hypothetical protein
MLKIITSTEEHCVVSEKFQVLEIHISECYGQK